RLLLGRIVGNVAVPVVSRRRNRDWIALLVWYVGEPSDNLSNTLKIIVGCHMGDSVLVHDLSSTKLKVGSVHLTAKKLVDGLSASENDRLAFDLNGALAETDKVGADTLKWLASVLSKLRGDTYRLIGKSRG